MNNHFEKLGKNIKYFRKLRGCNLEKLANITGLTINQLENIENGTEIDISLDQLFDIADALDVDPQELLGRN